MFLLQVIVISTFAVGSISGQQGTSSFQEKDAVIDLAAPPDNSDLQQVPRHTEPNINEPAESDIELVCTFCKLVVIMFGQQIKNELPEKTIVKNLESFCVLSQIQKPHICEGISKVYGKEIFYVLKHGGMDPNRICSFLLGEQCGDEFSRNTDWGVDLPENKPPVPVELPIPQAGAPSFKVLQISDTHYDPYYKEGSNAKCGEPLCCRNTSGPAPNKTAAAGKWGDFRCDTPKHTVDHMLAHIAQTHKDLDYILWTGDLPPHDLWNQTKVSNLEIIKETVKQMNQHFPNVPIFPALGNHESAPANGFPLPDIKEKDMSINWLYDALDVQWQRLLPQNVSQTVRRGAFYSVLLRPGFRIISLNMNYCYNLNWWLLLNAKDPADELSWFINELYKAELSNEKVHVIGHIPPGNQDCLKVWSRNFNKIIARFESTITAQFYGHTHFDEFEIFYDQDLSRPTSIAYIGPSVTPYENLNPGYRIYYIDGEHEATTHSVIDHETWIMDLQEANLNDNPNWYTLYTARAAYNMTALRPVDWHQLISKMARHRTILDLYYKNYYKDSPMRPACNNECLLNLLCDCISGRSHDREKLCGGLYSNSLLYEGQSQTFQPKPSVPDFVNPILKKVKDLRSLKERTEAIIEYDKKNRNQI